MSMGLIHVKIITPERVVFEGEVASVSLPTHAGEITVLPNHVPLVAALQIGELHMHTAENKTIPMAIGGGLVEVKPGSEVVILTESVDLAEEIDAVRAEEARARARTLMEEKTLDTESFADATAALERSLAQLRLAKKYRKTHTGHHGVKID